ncbi:Crp/Fnr family transcriptional regulator [Pseudorhodoferax sp.]|uniref:Crp/Fnr family transcriptional regulator n=1 Tax=Pseudorhodoferax sp. TaxID=1993553 RepID=UPI0039E648A1
MSPPPEFPQARRRGAVAADTLHQRRRTPTARELAAIPWLSQLTGPECARVVPEITAGDALPGDHVCRIGRPVTYWFGVVEGLLKMNSETAQGQTMTFAGLPAGGWFGEGTVLKREPYRYNVQALRASTVAGLPVDSFHWLLDHSLAFNRFIMNQLNERLAQFIAAREIDRLADPDLRVARSLAALFNPVLYPGVGQVLRITQQELAYLVGLSRQRVNEALAALQAAGLIRTEYGGLRVLDLPGLRTLPSARPAAGPSGATDHPGADADACAAGAGRVCSFSPGQQPGPAGPPQR